MRVFQVWTSRSQIEPKLTFDYLEETRQTTTTTTTTLYFSNRKKENQIGY